MKIATVTIGEYAYQQLACKVEQLNKRAAKLKLESITLSVEMLPFVWHMGGGMFASSELLYRVTIHGVEPRVDGWRMLARIEFDPDIGNVVKTAPGVDSVDPKYRTIKPVCDHCGTKRRRNAVVVIERDGVQKVIGHNCLADFLRDGDAESLGRYAEFCTSALEVSREFSEGGYGGGPTTVCTLAYLRVVSAIIRQDGWVPKSKAEELGRTPTSGLAYSYFNPPNDEAAREWQKLPVTEKDTDLATKALQWAASKLGDKSEYLNTIAQLARQDVLNWKYDGYVASIISAYQREMDIQQEARAPKLPREFFGEQGKRFRDVDVTIQRVRYIENDWGCKTILTFEREEGGNRYVLTWFATGSLDYDEGTPCKLTATVKAHEDHPKFGKTTVVTRGKLTT